jgi:hypothetical protein
MDEYIRLMRISLSILIQGEAESTLSDSQEYKNADSVLNQYYELDNGKLVMEGESEPKDIREDDY